MNFQKFTIIDQNGVITKVISTEQRVYNYLPALSVQEDTILIVCDNIGRLLFVFKKGEEIFNHNCEDYTVL